MRREKLKVVASLAAAAAPGQFVLDDQVGFQLRVAQQRMTAIFAAHMIEALTPTQFAVLAKLHEVGPCSQNHLGRLVHLDAATIKGVVDRLVTRGSVTALNDTTDRRRRAVALTVRGRELIEAAIQVAGEISAASLAPMTPEEQLTLLRLLKKLG